jgi:hypothetical protein
MKKLFKLFCSLLFFLLGVLFSSFLQDSLTKHLLLSFISFCLGAVFTFILRDVITLNMTKQSTGLGISLVVTFTWVASIIAEILIPDFAVSPFIHGIMGVIAAFFFKDAGSGNNGK